MLVVESAVLLELSVLLFGLGFEQKAGQILKRLLYVDIFLSADIVNLLDMVILGELVHPLLLYFPLSCVYLVAEDKDFTMRTVMILQLLVPIRAQILLLLWEYFVTLGVGDVEAENQGVTVAVDAGGD